MTDEGEFKKRVRKWTYPRSCAIGDAESLVDEAKKEILSSIHIEYGDDTRRIETNNVPKLLSAILKWLGDKNE